MTKSRRQTQNKNHEPLMKTVLIMSSMLILALSISTYTYINRLLSPVNANDSSKHKIVIKKGASISTIANTLFKNNLINSPTAFKLMVKKMGVSNKIQAGLFSISPSQSLEEIINTLTHGRQDIWITIPEGYRNEQIAEALSAKLSINKNEFTQRASKYTGKLFPDTYLIPQNASIDDIINIFLNNYIDKTSSLRSAINSASLTENQILTMASIVERETITDTEKPIVAGILLKRLNNDWPLQVDATIQYMLGKPGKWWPVTTIKDREIKSPYNTYLNKGLPPHPIANPGIESIKSVIYPKPTKFWFYLHDKNGKIRYAETTEEHQQNINRYIR